MADEIIDLTRYLKREPESDLPRGAMALWGADGERSRFALPLWRIIYLAQAELERGNASAAETHLRSLAMTGGEFAEQARDLMERLSAIR